MNTFRGYVSLIISCFIFHGWAVLFVVLGTIFNNPWMIGIGSAAILFWFGPGTPVIPLIIVVAMFIRRYILFERKGHVNIKNKWQELNSIEKTK